MFVEIIAKDNTHPDIWHNEKIGQTFKVIRTEINTIPPRYIVEYKHPSGRANTAAVIFACAKQTKGIMKEKMQSLQLLSDEEHLRNILKILRFDFWSDDERLYYIWMYTKMIIGKMDWMNIQWDRKYIRKMFRIVE